MTPEGEERKERRGNESGAEPGENSIKQSVSKVRGLLERQKYIPVSPIEDHSCCIDPDRRWARVATRALSEYDS